MTRARAGTGRELYRDHPAFATAVDEVAEHFAAHLDRPLTEVLFADPEGPDAALIQQPRYAQPALFALQVALHRVVTGAGITPDHLLGHSGGELTAAHLAGVLTLPDAVTLVAARARLTWSATPGGLRIALRASEDEVARVLGDGRDLVDIASVDGPEHTVIAGDAEAVERIAAHFAERGVPASGLASGLAAPPALHSPHASPILAEFRAVAATLTYRPPTIPLVSNVTGTLATDHELTSPDYWTELLRRTVRFHDGVRTLRDAGVTAYLELGPDAVLTPLVRQSLAKDDAAVVAVPALRHGTPEPVALLTALAELHVHGAAPATAPTTLGWRPEGPPPELPTYPFQRRRYWYQAPPAATSTHSGDGAERLLWTAVESADPDALARLLSLDDTRQANALLPALADFRRRSAHRARLDSWRYRESWHPRQDTAAGVPTGRWLLLVPEAHAGHPWVDAARAGLADRGATPLVLTLGPEATDPDRLAARLRDTFGDGAPPTGLLSLLAFDESPHPGHPALPTGLAAQIALVRAIGELGLAAPLWVATRGAIPAALTQGSVSPVQAQTWGAGRVIALEHPERWGGLIDLPVTPDEPSVARLCAALVARDGEDQIAIRPGGAHVRRLERAPRQASPRADGGWRTSGTTLITGGTGALGGRVARWLAGRGAEHLLLVSRRGLQAPGAETLAAELRALGTEVTIVACDIADRSALARVIAEIPATYPLRAVVHSAGLGADQPVADCDFAGFATITSGKTLGATHLDALLRDTPLDAFVLFSSVSAIWGSAEQAAYAAGNAHIDALARKRRADGLPATTINWGPWAGTGLAAPRHTSDYLTRRGIRRMATDLAVEGMAEALDPDETALILFDLDWAPFHRAFTAIRPSNLFAEIPEVRQATERPEPADTGAEPDTARAVALQDRLAGLSSPERRAALLDLVRDETAAVLGFDSAQDVAAGRPFKEMGFDSLTGLSLRTRLQRSTGLRLPATLVYDHPNAEALAGWLSQEVIGGAEPSETSIFGELDRLEAALVGVGDAPDVRAQVASRLTGLLTGLQRRSAGPGQDLDLDLEGGELATELKEASDDDLFRMLGDEFGIS
ncbi:SDR family NAD(P)-dependent oxidoreductase [Streptomyces hainanensis]|uniref:SDR family NAD(P)-dependent oxidoreductase n=1 Tax=Streptomyces hainanensis TaxID=402648 RepID=UPI0014054254|nr:SDR family NAD(P)-dependent oxidoreductase [Streptomyces hainanensis]